MELLAIFEERLTPLEAEPESNSEATIFRKKLAMTKTLLKISSSVELKIAPKRAWYGEYIALLEIRLHNPTLRSLAQECIEILMQTYNERLNSDEREPLILAMIQFIEPTELKVPFNQQLWHSTLRRDIQDVFMNRYPSVRYLDEDISAYYLLRQNNIRHEARKMRVVFLIQSHVSCDKILPVYEAMKLRGDIEAFLVVHANAKYKYNDTAWNYFHNKYPNDNVYDYGLMDLKNLHPDYVFLTNPYEERRTFRGFRINDLIKFTKVCIITYGLNTAYTYTNRLFDDYASFWRSVYLVFCSTATSKVIMTEKFPRNVNANLLHLETLGYPVLKKYYGLESSAKKSVLWTPRWSYSQRMGGSHFLEYKAKFLTLRKRYGDDVEIYFRPHMNLFGSLAKNNLMSRGQGMMYKQSLAKYRIIQHKTLSDLNENIRNVGIFLTDYSSIITELFLTGRPIIYCEWENVVPFPEFEEMFAALYVAHNWEDVEHYLDELFAGNDPLFDKRQEVAKKIYDLHKDATEKIIERLLQDFNAFQIEQSTLGGGVDV